MKLGSGLLLVHWWWNIQSTQRLQQWQNPFWTMLVQQGMSQWLDLVENYIWQWQCCVSQWRRLATLQLQDGWCASCTPSGFNSIQIASIWPIGANHTHTKTVPPPEKQCLMWRQLKTIMLALNAHCQWKIIHTSSKRKLFFLTKTRTFHLIFMPSIRTACWLHLSHATRGWWYHALGQDCQDDRQSPHWY